MNFSRHSNLKYPNTTTEHLNEHDTTGQYSSKTHQTLVTWKILPNYLQKILPNFDNSKLPVLHQTSDHIQKRGFLNLCKTMY